MKLVRNVLQIAIYVLFINGICVAQWAQIYNGFEPYAITVSSNYVFAAANQGTTMLRSSDHGTTWDTVNTGLTNSPGFTDVVCFAASGTNIFAGTYGAGVFLSTTNGATWVAVDSALTVPYPNFLTISSQNLLAGTNRGLYLSTNNGATWAVPDSSLRERAIGPFLLSGTTVLAGSDSGAFASTDNGKHWRESDSGIPIDTLSYIGPFTIVSTTIFASVGSFANQHGWGIYASTNNGATWNSIGKSGLPDSATSVGTLAASGTNLFADVEGKIYLSADLGAKWNAVTSTGFSNSLFVQDLAVDSEYLYAITQEIGNWDNWGIWRRPLSQITSVKNGAQSLPWNFVLAQNYPNPFNPSTVISYQLPSNVRVSLEVFDVLGRLVETLVNTRQSAGPHSVVFNAANLPSGVYLYRLEAGTYHDTKTLLLLK